MMPDIQEQLTESFHRQVRQVSAGPDLARNAYGQARRLQFRRRVAAGVACIAALALALPIGVDFADGGRSGRMEILPADTRSPEPRPSASEATTGVKVPLDLDALPSGAAPGVPWYADGVIHDGDRETPIGEVEDGAAVSFVPVADG